MINKKDPSEFSWGKYNADIPFECRLDEPKLFSWLDDQIITGYTADNVIRNRTEDYAVMFDVDGNEYWSHINKNLFDKYLKQDAC
tara:strand:- start:525 stop:779 length:255 start_codon:yes stop_codon:yes gene_type:complete